MTKEKQTTGSHVQRSLTQEAWLRFRENKMALFGLVVISALILISIGTIVYDLADGQELYNKYVISQNLRLKLAEPSAEHIFGCDEYGRDLFFRVVWGTRYSLFAGMACIVLAAVSGGILGAIAGFYGGRVDDIIMRCMDVMLAIPSMVLAMAIVAALGANMQNLLVALAIPGVPKYARVLRSSVMTVKDSEFVEAARAVGASDGLIIRSYIVPNALSPVIVQATLGVSNAILSIAGLSFLGLGIQPPTPEGGSILSSARMYLRDAWHISVIPGLAIMLCILSLNLLGDGLRDALDPKLKK